MNKDNEPSAADKLLYQFKVLSASIDWHGARLSDMRKQFNKCETIADNLAVKKQVEFLERRLDMEQELHDKLSEQAKRILD